MAKHNGQKNDLQNPTQKNKDRAPGTSIKSSGEFRYSGRVISSCSTSDTRHATVTQHVRTPCAMEIVAETTIRK